MLTAADRLEPVTDLYGIAQSFNLYLFSALHYLGQITQATR